MTRSPRVSVLMTVHNGAGFLRTAIDSLLAQTFRDWELVVVDDGSTDESPAILASYTDSRMRVSTCAHNIGRTPALRRAFQLARGELYAVLDADDASHPERLAKQVALLDAEPDVVLVGTWARYVDAAGAVVGGWHPPTDRQALTECFAWANPIVHSSSMYRAAPAIEVGGYPASLPYAQDCGLWIPLLTRGAVAMIPEELCDQRIVAASMTRGRRFRADVAKDGLALVLQARQTLGFRGVAADRNRDAIMIGRVKCGLGLMQVGRPGAGAIAIVSALARNPLGIFRSRAYRREHLR